MEFRALKGGRKYPVIYRLSYITIFFIHIKSDAGYKNRKKDSSSPASCFVKSEESAQHHDPSKPDMLPSPSIFLLLLRSPQNLNWCAEAIYLSKGARILTLFQNIFESNEKIPA